MVLVIGNPNSAQHPPVFLHHCDDTASFKMIVSQFYLNGNAKQAELVRVFGIQPLALKRWVKKYREGGPMAFFQTRRKRRAPLKKAPEPTSGSSARSRATRRLRCRRATCATFLYSGPARPCDQKPTQPRRRSRTAGSGSHRRVHARAG